MRKTFSLESESGTVCGRLPSLLLGSLALLLCLFSAGCSDQPAAEILSERGIPITEEALVEATTANQTYLIQLLTAAGVLPDASRNAAGQTALMIAARNGYTEAVDLLHSHSKNLDLVDERGMTALSHSICNGNLDIARRLLDAGASPDANCHGGQPLLVNSVIHSRSKAFDLLVEHGAEEGVDDALLIAITEGRSELAKRLIKLGADPNAGEGFGMPVLNVALQNDDDRCVDLLLESGADPNLEDEDKRRALSFAIKEDDRELAEEFLSRGADVELPCDDGSTPMQLAVASDSPKMMELLLDRGKAVIHPKLVTLAVDQGSAQILAVLLDHGVDVDSPDSEGDTLIARAVRSGDAAQVQLLIERGADPLAKCREGQSLLALATAMRRPGCVATLIAAGADPNRPLLAPTSEAYRELVDSRTFSYYAKRDRRFTPLMVAASHGHGDTIRALLANGASTGRYTRGYKRYPISFASEAGHIEAQQLIVGYDPKKREDQFKIVIDLSSQRAVMYKNGDVHLSSKVSTGKSGYRTPAGNYVVTHKHRTWTSTLYHSSMPYFMRFSCKAFGTHVGYVPNYPASHGCIRMPHSGARAFFNAAPRGTPVSIVN